LISSGIEKKATSYGTAITGQTYQPAGKALPSTARKPAIKRSNSTPASSKPTTTGARGSGTPIGANKYPGANQVNGAVGGAKKTVGSTVGGVNKTVGGVTSNASRVTGGVVGGGQKAIGGVVGRANSTAGGLVGGGTKALGGVTGGVVGGRQKALGGLTNTATKSIPPFKGPGSTPVPNKTLPKPFPNTNGLPLSNNAPAYPSAKKAPVKHGMPKPFTPPVETKKPDAKKPYPGTNTLPGQAPKVPVQNQRLKPLPRLGPQVGQGEKMNFI
jgi:hypothetical protein